MCVWECVCVCVCVHVWVARKPHNASEGTTRNCTIFFQTLTYWSVAQGLRLRFLWHLLLWQRSCIAYFQAQQLIGFRFELQLEVMYHSLLFSTAMFVFGYFLHWFDWILIKSLAGWANATCWPPLFRRFGHRWRQKTDWTRAHVNANWKTRIGRHLGWFLWTHTHAHTH